MNSVTAAFSKEQRVNAIQRLTALWAFTESGLGGIMHALQIPFTGLLVGGMAVIMICLIAEFSEHSYRQILKCVMVVLIVKAMAAPFTPVTAYIAVSFQALSGFALFSLMRVNYLSILLLSTIAMIESAIQKLLVLTLFFGQSIWKAMDNMVAFAGKQLGYMVANGSFWIMVVYLFIYIAGGFFIAWLAWRTISNFDTSTPEFVLKEFSAVDRDLINSSGTNKKRSYKKIWILLILLVILSALLFFFAKDAKQGWLEVIKTITWTLSAMLLWFVLIGPLFTKGIQKLLKKKESRYSDEVAKVLSFLPVLSGLTNAAWQQSKQHRGFRRWQFFFTVLIYAALTWSEPGIAEQNLTKNPV
ncbi:MAG: hypothetical protein ACKOU7_11360 [Ferruginibacter sp.]